MCEQVAGCRLPSLIAVVKTLLFSQSCNCVSDTPSQVSSTGVHSPKKWRTEPSASLTCPRRPSRTCWRTGTPLGTPPTQTYNCSPAPAAAFARCTPLLCLRSVRNREKALGYNHNAQMLIQVMKNCVSAEAKVRQVKECKETSQCERSQLSRSSQRLSKGNFFLLLLFR